MKKLLLTAVILLASLFVMPSAHAEELYSGPMTGFMMSPMNTRITLKPNETYNGSFYIVNPEQNTIPVTYNLKVQGFYRDEENNAIFEDVEGRSQIVNWITLKSPETNTLAPGEISKVYYTITVPNNPPAGGQYAAITAISAPIKDTVMITETVAMNFTIFTEIDGKTERSSEITELKLPFFLSEGNITASSKVKNTGNVHGTANYTLKITPLFSNTPVYSNESEPDKKLVLPDRTMKQETTWENTPTVGIFNVTYRVEFEGGDVEEITRLVIKCPIWLIIVVTLGLAGFIFVIVKTIKSKKSKKKNPQPAAGDSN